MEFIQKLNPEDYKNPKDNELYLKVYLGAIALFYTTYLISHFLLEKYFSLKLY